MKITPLVAIDCMTYNHAPYIEDAMNGFSMQETDFPFVAVIVDDASTDGEQDIIIRYLNEYFDMKSARRWKTNDAHFIEAQHSQNHNCWFAVVLLNYNFYQLKKSKRPLIDEWEANAKYVAMCEGDDYWIKNDKLQQQVDFLESNQDYSMCYSAFKTIDNNGNDVIRENYEKAMQMSLSGNILPNLLVTNFILTCTTIFKQEVQKRFNDLKLEFGHDYTIFLIAATMGKCHYSTEATAAYRKTPNGAMATMSNQVSVWFHETKLFFYSGMMDGSIIIADHCKFIGMKKLIAKYCYFTDACMFKKRYLRIIKRNPKLWVYMPEFYLKHIIQKIKKLKYN